MKRSPSASITPYWDQTLGHAELEDGCKLAARYGVASVCIKPYGVALAARILEGFGGRGRYDRGLSARWSSHFGQGL